jgi:serine/threonine protein phosphatase 1
VDILRRLRALRWNGPGRVEEPSVEGGRPGVPEGLRVYAVGDVHGRLDLLREMEDLILEDHGRAAEDRAVVVHLGDFVDRGEDSRGVIEHLLQPLPEGFERICICGNHDAWFRDFVFRGRCDADWLEHGGEATLASYGLDAPRPDPAPRTGLARLQRELFQAIPAPHRRFLGQLKFRHEIGDYLFCHAGIRPGRPIEEQTDEELCWIREPFLSFRGLLPRVVVHGHTASERPEVRRHRIGIDTGACWTGVLSCVVLEGQSRRFLATGKGLG